MPLTVNQVQSSQPVKDASLVMVYYTYQRKDQSYGGYYLGNYKRDKVEAMEKEYLSIKERYAEADNMFVGLTIREFDEPNPFGNGKDEELSDVDRKGRTKTHHRVS